MIIRGSSDLSHELFKFLETHAGSDFGRLEHLFHEITCLVISEGALQTTTKQVFVLPLVVRGTSGATQCPLLDTLLAALLRSMQNDKLREFCQSLGAEKLTLSDIKEGMIVTTLRRLNEALELKPNIAGLGVNVNAVLERILGPSQRALPGGAS